ncbi:hypothetical protein [Helicobacter bizzozeronii]|uniref:hypothetical protein n=1 Tax=Helicobacter bizzozeronii TaxID=56877 RepID=UPI000CEE3356|nr:hypothetical protein [Helicobacter bizzozeronii]
MKIFFLFLGLVLISLIILFVYDRLSLERRLCLERYTTKWIKLIERFYLGVLLFITPFLTPFLCARVGSILLHSGYEILALLSAPLCSLLSFLIIYAVYNETKPSKAWKGACLAFAGLNGVILVGGMGFAAYIFFGPHTPLF